MRSAKVFVYFVIFAAVVTACTQRDQERAEFVQQAEAAGVPAEQAARAYAELEDEPEYAERRRVESVDIGDMTPNLD